MNFRRDYFMPFPKEDLGGAISKPVDWAAASSTGRALLLDLKALEFAEGRWRQSEGPLFDLRVSAMFFSEHGDRNWSKSLASLFGAGKED